MNLILNRNYLKKNVNNYYFSGAPLLHVPYGCLLESMHIQLTLVKFLTITTLQITPTGILPMQPVIRARHAQSRRVWSGQNMHSMLV